MAFCGPGSDGKFHLLPTGELLIHNLGEFSNRIHEPGSIEILLIKKMLLKSEHRTLELNSVNGRWHMVMAMVTVYIYIYV